MSQAETILTALGGSANIVDIEPCVTRLRVEVADPALVDETALEMAGTQGLMHEGAFVQLIVGPDAEALASAVKALI
jgi:PTS system N-acetylglucosamine-specific IIB component